MKIVQLVPELNEGGVERGVVEFNRELVKVGYESIVISNGGKLVKQIINDGGEHIKFDVCSKNIFSAFSRVKKLKKIFKSIKPDIIHARSRVPAWLSYFAKDKFHFITTVHGFYSVNKYSEIMTKGERVICVSNPIREYVLKNYSVDEKKLRVIFRGVDFERFDIKKINKDFLIKFKNKWNLNNKFIISSVGRITQLKNYETIIKALSLLDERYVLLIVGGVREDKKNYFNYLKNKKSEYKNLFNNIYCVVDATFNVCNFDSSIKILQRNYNFPNPYPIAKIYKDYEISDLMISFDMFYKILNRNPILNSTIFKDGNTLDGLDGKVTFKEFNALEEVSDNLDKTSTVNTTTNEMIKVSYKDTICNSYCVNSKNYGKEIEILNERIIGERAPRIYKVVVDFKVLNLQSLQK